MTNVTPDSGPTLTLLERIRAGDRAGLDELLASYRPRVWAFVEARFDAPLRGRLDPSDVVQEVQAEVAQRIDDYLDRRPMPFHLWVRKTAFERLLKLRRRHQRRRRTVDREVPLPDRSSLLLARPLLAAGPSPSQQAEARELAGRVAQAVAVLGEGDQEVLLMRHAEQLPYAEIACLLDIDEAAARKRYGRALLRLRQALAEEGLLEDAP